MAAKQTALGNAKKKAQPLATKKTKPRVKTVDISLGKKAAKSQKKVAKTVKAKAIAPKASKKMATSKVVAVKNSKSKTPTAQKTANSKKKSTDSKQRGKAQPTLLSAKSKQSELSLLDRVKKFKIAATKTPLGRKIALIKTKKEAAIKEMHAGVLKKAAAVEERTDVAVPPYMTTPTPAMLKVFRNAAQENKKQRTEVERKLKVSGKSFLAKPDKNAKKFVVDLRLHTPATEGYFSTGGVEPGAALVRLARAKGIDIIAVTDSYSAGYLQEVKQAAEGMKITVLPGLELCCKLGVCEELQLVALFPETYSRLDLERVLIELGVPREVYGRSGFCLKTPFEQVIKIVERQGGVLIPTHVDKTPYRQMAITDLVEVYGFRAFDLVHPENTDYFKERWPGGGFTFFSFSNANSLAQVGTRITKVKLTTGGFEGIKKLVTRR